MIGRLHRHATTNPLGRYVDSDDAEQIPCAIQASQRRASVEYIPLPYGPAQRPARQPTARERSG